MELQKRKIFNDIRHMIDLNVSNFSLIISCTPQGWETLYEENAALVRRFSANVIFLESINENKSIHLVTKYLSQYRTDEFNYFIKKTNSQKEPNFKEIFPFTKEAIAEICSIAKGNISEILKYCSMAIDIGISEKTPVINSDNVQDLIAKHMGQ